jgi:hypothetical protein
MSLDERGVYSDLMREFQKRGHQICIISPVERKAQQPTRLIDCGSYKILKLQIGDYQKSSPLIKGISALTLDSKYLKGIKQYFSDVRFDLAIYSTPPIDVQKAVHYVKKRDNAKSYLLLKDIFPQNAADIGMLKKTGPMALLFNFYRKKEQKLYKISDYIGCMSPANADYLLWHNPYLAADKVEVCPNSIEPVSIETDAAKKAEARQKYCLPEDSTIFVYGGNLGKPQGIPFIIECLEANKTNNQAFFAIIGSGTEFGKLKNYFDTNNPPNAKLFPQLPKDEYESLLFSCDVGLIFLDSRFTIPNFPSRLLSYMQASMPVLAATDHNTDIGKIVEENMFGLWCHSKDVAAFSKNVNRLCDADIRWQLGANARKYLENNYTAKHSYDIIMRHFS